MKIFTNRSLIQKIIITFVCVFLLNFCIAPTKVHAGTLGGTLLTPIRDLATFLGDVAISLVQYGITGEWIWATDSDGAVDIEEAAEGSPQKDYWTTKTFEYPIIQISPELIFANQVEILNIDFIGGSENNNYIIETSSSAISTLRSIIAGWYVALRTIAIVGLLSVLIYIGIRIIISSTSQDKAKYKQRIVDWIVAFCLLFFMHYIMAGTISIVNKVDGVLGEMAGIASVDKEKSENMSQGVAINPDYGTVKYNNTNYLGGNIAGETGFWVDLFTGESSDDRDQNAIDKIREIISSKGYTETSSSDDFVRVSSESKNLLTTVTTYEYKITCKEAEYIIHKLHYYTASLLPEVSPSEYNDYVYSEEVTVDGKELLVSGNPSKVLYFINYARLFLNVGNNDKYVSMSVGYLIIYIILIVFTVMFAFRYMKRVIYIAFLTLMAPLVALTYPIDKIRDRKSASI